MKFFSLIYFVIFITHAYSQQLRVGYVKYASIKNGDTLSVHNTVVIKQEGELHLINKIGWGFYLNKGFFDLDSCYHVYKNIYTDYDSVKAIIDTIFPNGINGKFCLGCRTMAIEYNTQDINYQYGNIAFLHTNGNDLIKALQIH